jgi:hypothetical protein
MKIEIEKEDNRMGFVLKCENSNELEYFLKKTKLEMSMYKNESLYNRLRFFLGIVHSGDFVVENNNIFIYFTTSNEHVDVILKEVEECFDINHVVEALQ